MISVSSTKHVKENQAGDHVLNLQGIDPSYHECITRGLAQMDQSYLHSLAHTDSWLPGRQNIFNAFTQPMNNLNYILFGESPYPRAASANGYAFWDAQVKNLWSPTGLDKKVNRATSLRNIIKMLLVAGGYLDPAHTSQEDIAKLDKSHFVQTNSELFQRFIDHGFLLLNATLVLHPRHIRSPQKDAKAWEPFMQELLTCIVQRVPNVTFILLGQVANKIDKLLNKVPVQKIYAEHPYNITFITNPTILNFFRTLQLLEKF